MTTPAEGLLPMNTPAEGVAGPSMNGGQAATNVASPSVATNDLVEKSVGELRRELGEWLRLGRQARAMTLDELARITKVRVPTLEALEAGDWSHAPADVFLRGFVSSVAQTLGLPVAEARTRFATAKGESRGQLVAEAMLDSMAPLMRAKHARTDSTTPNAAVSGSVRLVPTLPGAVVAPVASTAPEAPTGPRRRMARGTTAATNRLTRSVRTTRGGAETAKPTGKTALPPPVTLVIDDANPEAAASSQDARGSGVARPLLPSELTRVSPPSQNGLTLAVIVVLIVATLTLSYLMRSPAPSTDGVTSTSVPSLPVA